MAFLFCNTFMLHYYTYQSNKAQTLVLLHGFCENSAVFNLQVQELKQWFDIITFDLPGFGKSCVHEKITIECMADKVKIALDALKIKSCVMIGHSMGGYVTLAFAKKHAQYLKGFGLLHSTAAADSQERMTKRRQTIKFIQENGKDAYFKNFFPTLFNDPEKSALAISNLIEEANKGTTEGIIDAIRAMMNRERTFDLLEQTKIPVFFAVGKYDNLIAEHDMLAQAALCNEAEICYLQESAHMGMLEEPTKLNHAIKHFIARVWP